MMRARYHAPAVAYDFERPFWAALMLWLFGMLLLLSLWGWCSQFQEVDQGILLAAVTVMLCAAGLLNAQWHYWPRGHLLWNGEYWTLETTHPTMSCVESVELAMGLDGGNWLWLRVLVVSTLKSSSLSGKVQWIFLTRQNQPAQWGNLRRAVYSSIALRAEQE